MSKLLILFFPLAILFVWVHFVAVWASLYWYYWWFDVVMHLWGGLLIGLGFHGLCTLRIIPIRPTIWWLLSVLVLVTVSWELFEWFAGLYNPLVHTIDTIQDVAIGFGGGLLMHFIITRLYNTKI